MSTNIKITINNKMSSAGNNPDPKFDMPLVTSPAKTPAMTAGSVVGEPDATIGSLSSGSGGIYAGPTNTQVRGIVGYTLPGAKTNLVIYFDTSKCRLGTFASNVVLTTDTVETVAKDNLSTVKGSYLEGGDLHKYTATADATADGDILKCTVTITASS